MTIGCPICVSYRNETMPLNIMLRSGGLEEKCAACNKNCGKPALLDLFSGGGGAARGYQQAGFCVLGIDVKPQPRYSGCRFHQDDALTYPLDGFAAIHASPPCQGYSPHTVSDGRWDRTRGINEPRLIPEVRDRLRATGLPYVIENVMGARSALIEPELLCGSMFGLPITRHRLFESNVFFSAPEHPVCKGIAKAYAAARGWDYRDMTVTGKGRHAGTSDRWAEILGIDFPMTQHNFRESIPPAYTAYIGEFLMSVVTDGLYSRREEVFAL